MIISNEILFFLLAAIIFLLLTFGQFREKRYWPILAILGPFYAWKKKERAMYFFFLVTNLLISIIFLCLGVIKFFAPNCSNLEEVFYFLYILLTITIVLQFIGAFYQEHKISERWKSRKS